MIAIIDYGAGNTTSVFNMLRHIGSAAIITNDHHEIEKASKIILPGVGAFDAAMQALEMSGLIDLLQQKVLAEKTPVLGICLGMQILTKGSEEGVRKGLGWMAAYTYKFIPSTEIKVPHMGWNSVEKINEHPLTTGVNEDSRFYFVHSYYVKAERRQQALLRTVYDQPFDSAIADEHIMGVQFHPEKSHQHGMKLLANFASL